MIGNIPEKVHKNSDFCINNILNKNGHVPFFWVNIYGTPYEEKQGNLNLFSVKRNIVEGSAYMGRVLLGMNLVSQENPSKGISYLGGHNEPKIQEYILFSDLYKVQFLKGMGKIKIGVKFGSHQEEFSSYMEQEQDTSSSSIQEET